MRLDIQKIRFFFLGGAAVAGNLLLKKLTGHSVPCVFYSLTGLKCPGCGITHMMLALLALDWKAAYAANPFLFVTGFFLIFEVIYEFFLPHSNSKFHRTNNVLLSVYCAALIVFGVVRNLSFI